MDALINSDIVNPSFSICCFSLSNNCGLILKLRTVDSPIENYLLVFRVYTTLVSLCCSLYISPIMYFLSFLNDFEAAIKAIKC